MITKKQYNAPQVVEIGDSVRETKGVLPFIFRDRFFLRRLLP